MWIGRYEDNMRGGTLVEISADIDDIDRHYTASRVAESLKIQNATVLPDPREYCSSQTAERNARNNSSILQCLPPLVLHWYSWHCGSN